MFVCLIYSSLLGRLVLAVDYGHHWVVLQIFEMEELNKYKGMILHTHTHTKEDTFPFIASPPSSDNRDSDHALLGRD